MDTTATIRSRASPQCHLCGTTGQELYRGMADRLFGAPGEWNLKRCPNPTCGLVWLDPMPVADDLPVAYREYYTHQDQPVPAGLSRQLYQVLLLVTGLARHRAALQSLFLAGTPPGRLLEIGCGTGAQLAHLRQLGWQVEGQELDAVAAAEAQRRYGLTVHVGPLSSLGLPAATYDAVAMNHVIEHVPDPVALLTACHRLLKPGGTLIVLTPNIASCGRRHFGAAWRGWDPPRHLHLFTAGTLRQLLTCAGFAHCQTWTTSARAVGSVLASLDIRQQGHHTMTAPPPLRHKLQAVLLQLWFSAVHRWQPDSGEECVGRAQK